MIDLQATLNSLTDRALRLAPSGWLEVLHSARYRNQCHPDETTPWPEHCFVPIGLVSTYLQEATGWSGRRLATFPAELACVSAWSATKGIYRFDDDLLSELLDTPITGQIPCDALRRLPEWCVFIPLPRDEGDVIGFFAWIDWWPDEGAYGYGEELRISLLTPDNTLAPFYIPLLPGETIEAAMQTGFAGDSEREGLGMGGTALAGTAMAKRLAPFVSVLLYLCSTNAEIDDPGGHGRAPMPPSHPRLQPTNRQKPPKGRARPVAWEVGYRIGAALRQGREQAEASEAGDGEGRRSPRPHVRRAHWHSFWRGPKSEPTRRRLVLKWIPPIFVGGEGEKPMVERPVE